MTGNSESVAAFRARARAWLADNMPRLDADTPLLFGDDEAHWVRARELQRRLYSGGFAGICFPEAYGGLGLPQACQEAFNEEARGYEMPLVLNIPTFSICCATLLEVGTEEQKREHISAAIRGDEVLVQFLSEPGGGSDLAGVRTRAERVGDTWVVNGAKIWSTFAFAADYALCLARTDADKPKHQGLTMFLMPTDAPGVTLNRIRMVDGTREFCEEFFDNVVLPDSAVVGAVDGGWAVASRQMFHERNAVGGGSPYVSGLGEPPTKLKPGFLDIVRASGRTAEPDVRTTVGHILALATVQSQLVPRVSAGIAGGHLPPAAASLLRLFSAEFLEAEADAKIRVAGSATGIAAGPEPDATALAGVAYLARQGGSLGGGSTEMSRNIVSERLLGMPREHAPDRGIPFSQVTQGSR